MRRSKVNKKIILCDLQLFAGREFYRVVFFPSVDLDMPNYLIPVELFDPSFPENCWRKYKVGVNIMSFIVG